MFLPQSKRPCHNQPNMGTASSRFKRGFKAKKPAAQPAPVSLPPTVRNDSSASVLQLVKRNFELLRDNLPALFVMVGLPTLVSQLGIALVGDGTRVDTAAVVGSLLSFSGSAWLAFSVGAVYCYQLRVIRGHKAGIIESYRQGLRFLPRIYGLSILVGALIVGGLILLIIPGIIVFRRYLLAAYYLVDHDLGIREAMQRSATDSKLHRATIWKILGLLAAILVVSSLPALAFPAIGRPITALVLLSLSFLLALSYREVALKQAAGTVK